MDLERKTIVIPARDCVRACECTPPCGGARGIRTEIWTFALVNAELQVGFALDVYTRRYLPCSPQLPMNRAPDFEATWHHGFPVQLELLARKDAKPVISDCPILGEGSVCWTDAGFFRVGELLGAFVDTEQVEQPEQLWVAMERMARPEIDRLLTQKAIYEQHERCPHCAGAGYARKR